MWYTMLITVSVIGTIPILYVIYRNKTKAVNILKTIKWELLAWTIGFKSVVDDIIHKSHSDKIDLPEKDGQVVVITGGLRGIGLEVIRMLLECNMMVVVGCREIEKGEHFANKMRMEGTTTGKLDFKTLDVSNMESVKKFAAAVKKDYPKIHVLINNAAIMNVPFAKTPEGFESQLATNYLGHFLLTHLLLHRLAETGTEEEPTRIILVSSVVHEIGSIDYDDINFEKRFYVPFKAYSATKLMMVLFGLYLNGMMKDQQLPVNSYTVHPGVVNTDLFNDTFIKKVSPFLLGLLFKPPDKGATPIVFCAVTEEAKALGGCYIANCLKKNVKYPKPVQEKLFKFTMDLLKIEKFGEV